MNKKKEKGVSIGWVLRNIIPKCIRVDPPLFIIVVLVSITHSICWGLDLYVRENFFNTASALAEGTVGLREILLAFALLSALILGVQILNGVANYLISKLFTFMSRALTSDMFKRIRLLSPEVFENTEMLDDINKAENGISASVNFFAVSLMLFVFYLPYFVVISLYFWRHKPILVVIVLIAFIPVALTQFIRAKLFTKLEDASAPKRREYEYYEKTIADREFFKETRLLGSFKFFRDKFSESYALCLKLRMKADLRATKFELSMNLVTIAANVLILLMLFGSLLRGEISVGAFAAVIANLGLIFGILEEVITMHLGRIAESYGATVNYMRFLNLPIREGEIKTAPDWGDITLKNVSFTYPSGERPAVENVSFTLHRGETLAVVGENGSGKSTLVRLISGIYLPQTGEVEYNGVPTRKIDPAALYSRTSAVFQKFQRYQMTLRENIALSTPDREPTDARLSEVCEMAGVDAQGEAFPDGYDTMLSREFDGVDLSGGQWQRAAIARAYNREHDLIILDEPTAAIDPYEETRIYNRFAALSREKSAVIVTHRIGSVRLADRILVMQEGHAVGLGTHEELLDSCAEYKRLWDAQQQWYSDNPEDAAAACGAV